MLKKLSQNLKTKSYKEFLLNDPCKRKDEDGYNYFVFDWTLKRRWYKEMKSKFPIQYFLFETLPNKINSIPRKYSSFIYWFKYRFIPSYRYHMLKLHEPGYRDYDYQLLRAVYLITQKYFSEEAENDIRNLDSLYDTEIRTEFKKLINQNWEQIDKDPTQTSDSKYDSFVEKHNLQGRHVWTPTVMEIWEAYLVLDDYFTKEKSLQNMSLDTEEDEKKYVSKLSFHDDMHDSISEAMSVICKNRGVMWV